jgi:hypothetical protein
MHFTYQPPATDLQQGDLLTRTPELTEVLREFHPHYHSNEDYKYLIVLTQTCDLVSREDLLCKARYISLAAVRSLDTAVKRELEKYQRSQREVRANYCNLEAKGLIKQFFARLLNNNELGYFYLHKDLGLGIQDPVVAFLSLSIAIKADLHYQKCLQARVAQLEENFQAKLGWLVGNMYSRVGTPDWTDKECSKDEFDKIIAEMVDGLGILWIKDQYIKKLAKEEKNRIQTNPEYLLTSEDVTTLVGQYTQEEQSKKMRIINRAVEVIASKYPDIDAGKARLYLTNDSEFSQLLK